jgi:hypothetical protein
VAVCAVALAGCNWNGEGKRVAAALVATKNVKTRAFTGSVKFDMSRMVSTGTQTAAAPKSMTMTFSGAVDARDAVNPRMTMTMAAEGRTSSIVAPGNGRIYFTADGRSYWMATPRGRARSSAIDPRRIYAALGAAVGGFRESPPITNAQGRAVPTVSARIDRSKLCGAVLDAFGESLGRTAGLGRGLGVGTGATAAVPGKGDRQMLRSFCRMMLKRDPRVWFGIDGGRLTDVELTADVTVPFAGTMGLEVQYHEYNQDGEQSGFDVPSGAVPLDSLSQLPGPAIRAGSAAG